MMTEQNYISTTNLSHRKKFAQFFTPVQIADFMAKWVMSGSPKCCDVLEPAFGLGVFSKSMAKLRPDIKVTGYDIDERIYGYAKKNFEEDDVLSLKLKNENYLSSEWNCKYDAIICNPPYLKFHDYDNVSLIHMVNQQLGINLNGFTNLYTLFLLKSIYQLKDNGRLAYIVPLEFLNSNYGVEVKRVLLQSWTLRHIIILDFKQCIFDDAITTACILLCEKSTKTEMVRFSKINDIQKLSSVIDEFIEVKLSAINPQTKWKQYYEDMQSSKYHNLVPLATFAKVSRGIATGANWYFTLNASKAKLYNLPEECLKPCICHSTDVQNLIFTKKEQKRLLAFDKTVMLFDGCVRKNDNVKKYIRIGEVQGVDKKYLTSCRTPWYALEDRKPSPIWVSVFNRGGLKFVRNEAMSYNLTTFHCVYSKDVIATDILFVYLVTDMAKEIFMDNSRQYGNGLTKFEPNDLNKSNVVDLRLLSNEEKVFLNVIYANLHQGREVGNDYIKLADCFFRMKYTGKTIDIDAFFQALRNICKVSLEVNKTVIVEQINFFEQTNFHSQMQRIS